MNRIAVILPSLAFLGIAQIGFAELLPQVPDSIPEPTRSELNTTRSQLDSRADEINSDLDKLKSECTGALKNTPKGDACLERQKAIHEKKVELFVEIKRFKSDLAAAKAQGKTTPSNSAQPTVVDLAKDPELVKESQLRLDQINARLGRIQKAIDILGDANPEWAKEWENLHKDQTEATHGLMWNSLDLLTLGLAEGYKSVSEAKLKKAQEVFQGQEFEELMRQKTSLEKMRATFGGTQAFDKWINDLNKVEQAANRVETAEAIVKIRDLAADGKEIYQNAKEAAVSDNAMDKLYHTSTLIGEIAVPLTSGVAAKVAVPTQAAAKLTEAGLRVKLIYEEEQQFNALSSQAVHRNHKKLELMAKREELQNQAKELEMVIQRSKGVQ
jgi:hypothetical protein